MPVINYNLRRMLLDDPHNDQMDVDYNDPDYDMVTVAQAELYGMDPYRQQLLGHDPFMVADSHSDDTYMHYERVFDEFGVPHNNVVEQFVGYPKNMLFLHNVTVRPDLRGRGLGSLLAADAILTLADSSTGVFAHPASLEHTESDDDRRRQNARNEQWLDRIGFVPFGEELWTFDINLLDNEMRLAALREPPAL